MDKGTGVDTVVQEINRALSGLRLDRWQLSGLYEGRLWIIADSRRTTLAPGARCTRISSLARACLLDRCPVSVSSIFAPDPQDPLRDWELDWPSLVYVPVSTAGRRGVGVLLIGSRTIQIYNSSELRFLGDLGEVVAPWLRKFLADNGARFRRRAA